MCVPEDDETSGVAEAPPAACRFLFYEYDEHIVVEDGG